MGGYYVRAAEDRMRSDAHSKIAKVTLSDAHSLAFSYWVRTAFTALHRIDVNAYFPSLRRWEQNCYQFGLELKLIHEGVC